MIGLNYVEILGQLANTTGNTFTYRGYAISTDMAFQWLGSNPRNPALFVTPAGLRIDNETLGTGGDWRNQTTEYFYVTIFQDNKGDFLAQNSIADLPTWRDVLYKSLAGWHPPSTLARTRFPLVPTGGETMVEYQGQARYGWRFEFGQTYQVQTTDGWVPTGPTLTSITANTSVIVNSVITNTVFMTTTVDYPSS